MPELTPSPTPSGKPPYIDPEHVRDVLEAMLHLIAEADPRNPLYFLAIVDENLVNSNRPSSPNARIYRTRQILIDLISSQLAVHRNTFQLPPPSQHETYPAALRSLQNDARVRSAALMGWSCLYYRFVRVDLELSPDDLSVASSIHKRSLQRYQSRVTEHLTQALIELETAARARRQQRRLLASLPKVKSTRLLGREKAFEKLKPHLSKDLPAQAFVTGEMGIGKTAFVREVVRQQIQTHQYEQVLWIENPKTIQFIHDYIRENTFLPEDLQLSLREYLLIQKTAIIIDEAWSLLHDTTALDDLLHDLRTASMFLTNQTYKPLQRIDVHIGLQPLTRDQTIELARHLADPEFDRFDEVWERTGGNPLAVHLLMQNPEYYDTYGGGIVQQLLAMSYQSLTPELKLNCLMLALCPSQGADTHNLTLIWGLYFNTDHMETLTRHRLVEWTSTTHLRLLPHVRNFLEGFVARSPEDRVLLGSLISELEIAAEYHSAAALPIVEHLLLSGWTHIEESRKTRWMEVFAPEGVKKGHWAIWREILSSTPLQHPFLHLLYGVCLRRLANWDLAEQTFTEAIIQAGYKGMFIEQAYASLELAILLRYKGEYERAANAIKRAERTAAQYQHETLLHATRVEQAQIAIDLHDGAFAQQCLANLSDSVRVLSLRSEAALLQNDLEASLMYAETAIKEVSEDKSTLGRLYILIGRIHNAKTDRDLAKRCFSLAITLLEQSGDKFGLARAHSNLGALLIHKKTLHNAQQLLLHAEQTQALLGDRVGLKTTQHNLQIVRQKLAGGNRSPSP
jgi:tetratricopeptide (TPR) repeat protein